MTLRERLERTREWAAFTVAAKLPKSVRYWSFIQTGAAAMPDNTVVPEALFVDLLKRVEK